MVVKWGLRGRLLLAPLLLGVLASLPPCPVFANPTGGTVSAGNASISSSGNTLTVNQSTNSAVIDWRGFDINQGETTNFVQPSSSSITLNRVNSPTASQINGALNANGNIVIVNQNGVLFGKNAKVNVNSLVVSTADIDNADFMAGNYAFNKAGNPNAAIQNEGMITAKQAGLVGFVAPNVLNSGTINAKLGTIQLASGDTFTVDLYGDNLMSVQASPALQSQLVQNTGKLKAAGGTIKLTAAAAAQTVNSLIQVGGELDAPAIAQKNGSIYIFAEGSNAVPDNVAANKGVKTGSSLVLVTGKLNVSSKHGTGGIVNVLGDAVGVSNTATINANGANGGGNVNIGGASHGTGTTPTALTTIIDDGAFINASATQNGNGGNVTVWSDGTTNFSGSILAQGGLNGGNGGTVETSGEQVNFAGGIVNTLAAKGSAGNWLIDPTDLIIDSTAATAINNSLATTSVTLQTTASGAPTVTGYTPTAGEQNTSGSGNITINSAISWNAATTLTLNAYNAIIVNAPITVSGSGGVVLTYSTASPTNLSFGSSGNITYGGGGATTGQSLTINGNSYTLAYTMAQLDAIDGVSGVDNSALTTFGAGLSGKYALANSINANGTTYTQALIGTFSDGTSATKFSGVFEGLGNTISNLTIAATSASYVGLFGYNGGGTLRDIGLVGGTFSYTGSGSNIYLGSLVGINNNAGSIIQSYATGAVTYNDTATSAVTNIDVGGLVGNNNGSSAYALYSSYATGAVTAQYGAGGSGSVSLSEGGLAGVNGPTTLLINSYATGNVGDTIGGTSTQYLGGLVGYNQGNIEGTGSSYSYYSTGTVSYTGTNTATFYLGGLVGCNYGASGVVTQSYASGAVTYNDTATSTVSSANIGGLVGYNNSTAANSIISSYATGTVTAQYGSGGSGSVTLYEGGLVGQNTNTSATSIVNSYATGNVGDTLGGTAVQNIGGLVGSDSGGISGTGSLYSYYAAGTVSYGGAGSGTIYLGGLAGIMNSTLSQTYSSGAVTLSYTGTSAPAVYVGGLLGRSTSAAANSIYNSYATGAVLVQYGSGGSGSLSVNEGGLVGFNNNGSTTSIVNSYATGNVSAIGMAGSVSIGGLVGLNYGTITATGNSFSYATGNVSYTGSGSGQIYVGGLVGQGNSSGAIAQSYATGAVTLTYTGTATGATTFVGGLLAFNASSSTTSVSNSYATGAVLAQYGSGGSGLFANYLGGLVADNPTNTAITNSYATGSVIDLITGGTQSVGGLVGYNTSGTISQSYSTGYVYKAPAASGYAVGSVGYNGGTVSNVYWDTTTSGTTTGISGGTTTGATGYTTAQLQANNASYMTNLGTAFAGGTGGLYPYLSWQVASGTPQAVSGVAYSDNGVTAIAGGNVGILVNGGSSASLLGSNVSTGANGYYYFLLSPGTLAGTGSELLTYLTGTTKGNALDDGASGSITGLNIWGNTLRLVSSTNTPASVAGGLATAMGANSGSNFLGSGTVSGGVDTVTTTSGGIYLVSAVTTAGSDSLVLSAAQDITVGGAITTNGGAVTLRSDNAGTGNGASETGSGAVYVNANIATSGGAITIGGGSGTLSAGNGYAVGDAQYGNGVYITGTTSAGSGNIIVNGLAASNGGNGVYMNFASLSVTGNGNITINGIGRGVGNSANQGGIGSQVAGISAVNGTITLIGSGANSTGGSNNNGIGLYAGQVTTTGTTGGNIIITGTGGVGAGSNTGVSLSGGDYVQTANGSITVTGIAGSGSGNGLYLPTYANVLHTTGTGNITVYADSIALGVANAIASAGSLTIAPYTHGNSVGVGPASGSTDNYSDAMISDTTAASYVFGAVTAGDGSASTGLMTVNTATNFGTANVSFISGGAIDLAGTVTKSSGAGAASYLFQAGTDIYNANSAGIAATTGSINLTFDSNYVGNGGAINLSGGTIATNGGSITMGGGSSGITGSNFTANGIYSAAATGYAVGDGTQTVGINIANTLNAGGGNILVNGKGYNSTGNGNGGISVSGTIQTGGSGTININGVAQSSAGSQYDTGITVSAGTILNSGSGTTIITGQGAGSSGTSSVGVYVTGTNGTIKTTGSGTLEIYGVGGTSSGGSNPGVYSSVQNGIQSTGAGSIIVTGIKGSSINSYGIQEAIYGGINTSGTGNITIYADTISLSAANAINSAGSLTIAPYTHGNSVGVGPTSGSTDNYSDAMIADTSAASYVFGAVTAGDGSATSGLVTVNTATNFGGANVSFISGGAIDLAGTLTKSSGAGAASYLFQAGTDIYNANSAGIAATTGSINLTFDSNYAGNGGAISLSGGTIATNGGSITLGGGTGSITAGTLNANGTVNVAATGYAVGDATYGSGVTIANTLNAGSGTVIINGQGYNGSVNNGVYVNGGAITGAGGSITVNGNAAANIGNGSYGVYLTSPLASITNTGSGTITLTGVSAGSSNSTTDYGLYVTNGAVVTTVNGTLTLNGTGGGAGSGGTNYGVFLSGGYTPIKTAGSGALVINGTGGDAGGTGSNNFGVAVFGGIQMTGTGTITITGTGGSSTGGGDYGFYSGSAITGNGGTINISGTGYNGGANSNSGINVTGSTISNIGTGTLTLTGNVTGSATSYNDRGVLINGSGAVVSTVDGLLTVTGTGGGAGSNGGDVGVYVQLGTIKTTGLGGITITGTGGDGSGTGTGNYGIYSAVANGVTTSGSGNLTLTGIAGGGTGYGVYGDLANEYKTTGTGNITVYADTISLSAANAINSVGSLTIAPYTHGNSVGVGPTSGSTDNYSDAMIADLTAASYVFGATTAGDGSAATGNMTVNTGTNFGAKNVSFISGGTISFANTLTTTGGNITFNQPVVLTAASTINAGSGTETFSGTINGAYSLSATAGAFSFGGAIGGTTALGAISLTSTNAMSLPSITATSLLAQTTGSTANLTIASGSVLTASGTGTAVRLAAGQNFINNAGSGAISLTGTGSPRWLIFSTNPTNDSFGSLNSNNTAIWNATYAGTGGTISQSGDRYVFAYQPTVTVALSNSSPGKIYGTDYTSTIASDYSISGLQAAVSGAYLADTNVSAFSGTVTVTSTGSAASASVAGGPYAVTITQNLTGVDGYAVAYGSVGSLTVTTAPLTITANSPSMTYGASSLPTLSASYSGFVNSESSSNLTTLPTVTTTAMAYNGTAGSGSSVGTYSTTASGGVDSNYNISYVSGVLTVGKANLTITANSPSMTYGAASLPSLSASYSGFANGDSSSNLTTAPTVTTAATAYNGTAGSGSSVGTYSTTAAGAVDVNYNISYVSGTLTVNKANLTITANSPSMTYGVSSLPTLSASYTGLANGDTSSNLTTAPTVTTTATAYNGTAGSGSSVGTYSTTAAGAVDGNYNISYVGGTLTVNPTTLTITANSPSMTYGSSILPSLSASYSGFANGDTSSNLTTAPTVTTTATAYNGTAGSGSSVGSYTTTASGAVDNNYTINYVGGMLTVGKANLTITANSPSMTYGSSSLPSLSASYSGLANGDTSSNLTTAPTVTTTATAYNGTAGSSSNAGTYATTAAGAVDNNYNISYVGGTLTVNPVALTVTADSTSMTYGGTRQPLTASYSGFVNGDTSSNLTTAPTVVSATPVTANAGTYTGTITASGTVDNNYNISYVAGDLTIGKAYLTITADNKTITYGTSVPTSSITYNGLVNGDRPSSLTTQPTLTTSQSGIPNAGTYADAYTVSGAPSGNYTISYVNGVLTVNKANLTVTTYGQSINLGQPLPIFTGSNNLIAQDIPLVNWSYAPISYSGGIGSYLIGATASDPSNRLANYNISMNDGTLAVTGAAAAQIPSTVQVTSQNPLTNITPYVPVNTLATSGGTNSSGNTGNSSPALVFTMTSGGLLARTSNDIYLEITPALQQQLGYAPQANWSP